MKKTSILSFLRHAFVAFAALALLPVASLAAVESEVISEAIIFVDRGDTGIFRKHNNDKVAFYVWTEPALDESTIPGDFTLNFRLEQGGGNKKATYDRMVQKSELDDIGFVNDWAMKFVYEVKEDDETPDNRDAAAPAPRERTYSASAGVK